MELQTYLTILWRLKWIIVITAFVVVVIIGRAQTRQEAVQAVPQQLNTVKAVPVGIVVNQAQYDSRYDYYHPMLPQTKK